MSVNYALDSIPKTKDTGRNSFFLPLDVVISDVMAGTVAFILSLAWFGHENT